MKRTLAGLMWDAFAKVANEVECISAPSETAARLIRPHLSKPVLAISNGVDLARFSPGPGDERVRASYDLPAGPFFLFVGRLEGEKELDLIVRALARLDASLGWSLVIAGKGNQRKALEKLANELGVADRVHLPGFVADDDLPDLYRLASCFVIACTCELQSIVSLEAMGTGLPIIGVNALALPELVHHGVNGFSFEPGDVGQLAERMHAIASNEALRGKMGRESLSIVAKHDIDQTFETFEGIYARIAGVEPEAGKIAV